MDEARKRYSQSRITLSIRDMQRTHLLIVDYPDVERPRTRADCEMGPRPCPFVSCRHHLLLDVAPNGSIHLPHGTAEVTDVPETCALDVASRGPRTLAQVGRVMALTRERLRQLEEGALAKITNHPVVISLSKAG